MPYVFEKTAGWLIYNFNNFRKWTDENPRWNIPVKGIQRSVNVWAAIYDNQLIGPYFFNGNVDGDAYLDMLENFLLPEMDNRGIVAHETIFQHDGASAHFRADVRDWIDEQFGSWIGRGGPTAWPARSPDLTVMDFFLWGRVKDIVYREVSQDEDELKGRIAEAFQQITPEMLRNTQENFLRRIDMCVARNGGHFETFL